MIICWQFVSNVHFVDNFFVIVFCMMVILKWSFCWRLFPDARKACIFVVVVVVVVVVSLGGGTVLTTLPPVMG